MRGSPEAQRLRWQFRGEDWRAMQVVGNALKCGTVTGAAKKLGVARITLHRWLKEFPPLAATLRSARLGAPERYGTPGRR